MYEFDGVKIFLSFPFQKAKLILNKNLPYKEKLIDIIKNSRNMTISYQLETHDIKSIKNKL